MTGADLKANLLSRRIKEIASGEGFYFAGISEAAELTTEARRLESWLNKGHHGKMSYMERNFEKRIDPRKLVPGARSVISLLLNYYPGKVKQKDGAPLISKYAYGEDYHFVIKRKLKNMVTLMVSEFGDFNSRVFVDSAPVMDKAWAEKAGLGWQGKHSNLINKKAGSFFFIAEIISDLELEPDKPSRDYCGTCTKCIDACPTDAIVEPYVVDANKCISYLTIELKEALNSEWREKLNNWVFGCDICQDVCPWNRFSKPHSETSFLADSKMLNLSKEEWAEITEDIFDEMFGRTAIQRTGFTRLKDNIHLLQSKPID